MPRNNYIYEKRLGVKFPFAPNATGKLQSLYTTDDVVKQNLLNFFKTERRSRIMKPELGIKLRERLGDVLSEDVRNDLSTSIREQLRTKFTKINVIDVTLDQPEEFKFNINVKYKLKSKINQIDYNEINITIE